MLARRSGMDYGSGIDYSSGIQFQTSLINVEEAKALTMNNQPVNFIDKKKTVTVWLLRSLTCHLKEMPYRAFLPKCKKRR